MKTLLANKQNEEQKKANENARYLFIMAMMNLDEKVIFTLLNKNSKFLGNKNNWQFSNWLKNQFKGLIDFGFHSQFSEGISLDYYPGSETLSFYYSPMGSDEDIDNDTFDNFKDPKIKKLCFALNFNAGKIIDIRLSKKSIELSHLTKLKLEN